MVLSRRGLFTGAAGFAVKPKKKRGSRVGMQPDQQGVFFQLIIQGGGEFTYDAAGNLRTANVGQTTTDPIQGITCYAGFSTFNGFGAVISLFSSTLDAQLWYADTGTSAQGALVASIATVPGTDPFGNAFKAGVVSYAPGLFADLAQGSVGIGSTNGASLTTAPGSVGFTDTFVASGRPIANMVSPITSATGGVQIALLGESQDASKPAQAVIASSSSGATPVTNALLEVQGAGQFSGILSPGAGTNGSGSAPSPPQALANGTAAQLSDTTRDYMIYFVPSGAGNFTIQIGPTSAVGRTILPATAVVAGALYSVRIPAGWFVKWTGTGTVTLSSQTVVGC